jgi:hypothetical protein
MLCDCERAACGARMKITLKLAQPGPTLTATLPFNGADHVEVANEECPTCHGGQPLLVAGKNIRHDHDTYRSDAHCLCCGAYVGELRAKVDTIFGIDEDEAVLNGRCRVY